MKQLFLVIFLVTTIYACGSDSNGSADPVEPDPAYHWLVRVLNNEAVPPQVIIFEDCGGTADQANYMAAFSGYATDGSINCYAERGAYRYIERY